MSRARTSAEENNMKQTHISIVALLLFGIASAGHAQTSRWRGAISAPRGDSDSMVSGSDGPVYHNANQCAGEHADAVWAPNNSLVGYTCSDNAN